MRLIRTVVHGLQALSHAEVDWADLGPVVAITGGNGEGKTTLLEGPISALYRCAASRDGNLVDFVHGRDDAYVEATFEQDGSMWTARLSLDGARRKVEQSLLLVGIGGALCVPRPVGGQRAEEIAETVSKLFGSRELILASAFCAQNRAGDFAGLGRGERKALFVEALGIKRLEAVSGLSRARASELQAKVEALRGQLAGHDERARLKATQEAALGLQRDEITRLKLVLDELTERLAGASAAKAELLAARAAYGAVAQRLEKANLAEREAEVALERSKKQSEDAARRAQTRTETINARRSKCEAQRKDLETLRVRGMPAALDEARGAAQAKLTLAEIALERVRGRHEALTQGVATLQIKAQEAKGRLELAHAARDEEQRRIERLTKTAGLLGRVPCTASEVWKAEPGLLQPLPAICPLLKEAQGAKAELETPAVDHGIGERAAEVKDLLEQVQKATREQGALRTELQAAQVEATACAGQLQKCTARYDEALRREHDIEGVVKALADIDAEVTNTMADDLDALEAAQDGVKRAEAALVDAGRELQTVSAEVEDASRSMDRYEGAALLEASTGEAHAEAAAALSQAERAAAATAGRLEALAEEAQAAVKLERQVSEMDRCRASWEILCEATGRSGIQALEIDAAGPEVAELCNELLASCFGPRFSISFQTVRQNRTGDGHQEVFDVIVHDDGVARRLEWLSGGEQVIVKEALGLGIAIWNARRGGVRWRTLFRDETSGALSRVNAVAYVDMLRRALSLGGFDQVIFVSHQPEVTGRADSVVVVADGTATVA